MAKIVPAGCIMSGVLLLGILSFNCKPQDAVPALPAPVCKEIVKPTDTYIYPILPGTPEWAKLTGPQMLPASQIPANVLSVLSTEALVQSWMDFPLVGDLFAHNILQDGVDFFIVNFSGLAELFKRQDAAAKLFRRYEAMNPYCIENRVSLAAKGGYTFTFTYTEVILAQDHILSLMSSAEKKSMVAHALTKYSEKKALIEYFGNSGTSITVFLCMRAMRNAGYKPFLDELNGQFGGSLNNLAQNGQ